MQASTVFAMYGLLASGCGGSVASGPADSSSGRDVGAWNVEAGGEPAPSNYEGGGEAGVDAACSVVLASNYDESCTVDTDCVGVGQVSSCPAAACDYCEVWAINKAAMARYQKVFSQAIASMPAGSFCGCPCIGVAICRAGKCQQGYCGPDPSDTLPGCASAGGQCAYTANATCDGMGPRDACAYSDEFCCLHSGAVLYVGASDSGDGGSE